MSKIVYLKKSESVVRIVNNDYSVSNMLTKKDSVKMSVALSKLSGVSPAANANLSGDRVYYFISGKAIFLFNDFSLEIESESVLYIPAGIEYRFEGEFEAVLINSPAYGVKEKVFDSKTEEVVTFVKLIKKVDTFLRSEGEAYEIRNYLVKEYSPKISVAVSKLNGKTKTNYNLVSDRAYYFIDADAEFIFDDHTIKVEKETILYVPAKTKYKMTGSFHAVLLNSPAFEVSNEVFSD